jgi:hypothetical protein
MGTKLTGHKTLIDGTHVPLSEDEAEAIWKAVEHEKAHRAKTMPTTQDALRTLIQAQQRLNELGWWEGGGLRVKRGADCAVAQTGSTGMWTGHFGDEWVTYCDCVSKPRDVWMKPLDALTDDEREHLQKCDQREAVAFDAEMKRYASLFEGGAADD